MDVINDQIGAYTLLEYWLQSQEINDENTLKRISTKLTIDTLELMKIMFSPSIDELNKFLIHHTIDAAPPIVQQHINTALIELATSPHRLLRSMAGESDDECQTCALDLKSTTKSITLWKITIPTPDQILTTLLAPQSIAKLKSVKRIIISLDYTMTSGIHCIHYNKIRQVLEHIVPEPLIMIVFIGSVASNNVWRHMYNISGDDFKQYDGKKLRDDLLAPVVGAKRKREANDDDE